jgi:nucleoside recognition membrane protein YjiH
MPFVAAIVLTILLIIPLWQIFLRTGLPPVMSLLCLVPVIGPVVAMAVLALSEWPLLSPPPRKLLKDLEDPDKQEKQP